MSTNSKQKKIEAVLLAHLAPLTKKERISEIESLLSFLEFERRFTELTPEEKEQMYTVLISELPSEESKKIATISDFQKQREFLTERARKLYQSKLQWFNLLHLRKNSRPPRSSER